MSKGIPVLGLIPGCHAEKAGVKVGDILISANGIELNTMADYIKLVNTRGHSQTVVVLRDGELIEIEMALGKQAEGDLN